VLNGLAAGKSPILSGGNKYAARAGRDLGTKMQMNRRGRGRSEERRQEPEVTSSTTS